MFLPLDGRIPNLWGRAYVVVWGGDDHRGWSGHRGRDEDASGEGRMEINIEGEECTLAKRGTGVVVAAMTRPESSINWAM